MLSLVTFTGEIADTKVVLHKEKKKKINKHKKRAVWLWAVTVTEDESLTSSLSDRIAILLISSELNWSDVYVVMWLCITTQYSN